MTPFIIVPHFSATLPATFGNSEWPRPSRCDSLYQFEAGRFDPRIRSSLSSHEFAGPYFGPSDLRVFRTAVSTLHVDRNAAKRAEII